MALKLSTRAIRLLISDFNACFRFYRDVMGFDVMYGKEDGVYASFQAGLVRVQLFKRQLMAEAIGSADKPQPSGTECQDKVALIFNVDNVDNAYQQLKAREVTFITEPTDRTDWGERNAHFRDPDGNLIEITRPLEEET